MSVTYENPAYDMRRSVFTLNRDADADDESDDYNDITSSNNNKKLVERPGRWPNDHFERADYLRNDDSLDIEQIDLSPTDDRESYREMAVDVPSDFKPHKKEPPRMPGENNTRQYQYQNSKDDPMLEERIKKYQNDIKKRREMEEKQQTEEEFLRTSLRGSKKLQALEKKRKIDPVGWENEGFMDDEEDSFVDTPRPQSYHSKQSEERDLIMEPICGVEKLIVCFNNVRSKLDDNDRETNFLVQFFQNPRLQLSVAIHEKILDVTNPENGVLPVCHDTRSRCQDMYETLPAHGDACVRELKSILCKAEFQSLLYTHDRVACQYSEPCEEDDFVQLIKEVDDKSDTIVTLPQVHEPSDNGHVAEMAIDVPAGFEERSRFRSDEVRIVRLLKTAEPLGATVKNDGDSVLIARIIKGGLAEKSGQLKEGDEILEVNGQEVCGLSVNDVSDMLASMQGPITFCIIPSEETKTAKQQQATIHMRALFSYDPEEDIYIPCRELGLNFSKCDVLHVINQEDANWWQAYRDGEDDDNQLAGLIPSRSFQERREAMKQVIAAEDARDESTGTCCRKRKKKKPVLYNTDNEGFDAESIPTYEDVALYYPQPNRKRPIVLIGPPNVGRQELRQRLMESDANRFAAAIPHTSRPRKDNEKDAVDYHFIPRQVFETDILQNKFIEHGEYEHNLYGTSVQAVQAVIDAGKVCLLNVNPQSLKVLKTSSLKPYVFFIAPANLEKLRMNCHKQGLKLSEEGLKEIITRGREIEETFGHYFDYYMVNYDIERTFDEVLAEINRLDLEPQWVPARWLYQ